MHVNVCAHACAHTHTHTHTPQDDEGEEHQEKKFRSSFSPGPEVQRVPRLDKEFRKPPPPHQHKRRMPSRVHLRTMAAMEPGTGSSGELCCVSSASSSSSTDTCSVKVN